jgi:uncharacterized membrane protein
MRASARRVLRDRGWLLPALGAVLGIVLAEFIHNLEGPPDPARWAVSVDRARDTLLGSLAIVFTGLSIVLAMTATAAQNLASRFSIRLLSVQQRGLRDKVVVGAFSLTTAFILTTQIELRALPADTLAPQTGLGVSAALVILSGATIIWYISASMRSIRLDRAMQQVIRLIRRTVRTLEHVGHGGSLAPVTALEAPVGATPLQAQRPGYIAGVDMQELRRLATESDVRIGIEVLVGTPVVRGQRLGWIMASGGDSLSPDAVASAGVQIARARDPQYDAAYGIRILVDMAVMALSPAVNDPYTAVEVLNELTFVLTGMAHHHPGPRGYAAPDDSFIVVRAGRSLGDYLDLATAPILLYGATDPQVVEALGRLAAAVEPICETEADRERARDLARRAAATGDDLRQAGSPANTGGAEIG